MVKVARLYHEHGVRQPEIARRLHISQARVSRLLKQAEADGIVRTTVVVPEACRPALEEALEAALRAPRGGRRRVLDDERARHRPGPRERPPPAYLEASLTGGDVVGISSWSSTLLAAVDAMRPLPPQAGAERVLQLFGGVGNPAAEAHAARLTQRFADLTGAQPTFLLAPGIATSAQAREALMHGPVRPGGDRRPRRGHARAGRHRRARAVEPAPEQRQHLRRARAGRARRARRGRRHLPALLRRRRQARVQSDVDRRVIGVTLEQLA